MEDRVQDRKAYKRPDISDFRLDEKHLYESNDESNDERNDDNNNESNARNVCKGREL